MSGPRRKAGGLGPHVEGYRTWLAQQGYTQQRVRNMLKDLGQVGVWLSAEGLEAAQVNEEQMAAFRSARHEAGCRRVPPGTRAIVPLQTYLREVGVVRATEPPMTPLGVLLRQYRSWLVHERGLAATTVLR